MSNIRLVVLQVSSLSGPELTAVVSDSENEIR